MFFFDFAICIDMNNDVSEDDDIDLGSFGVEDKAPPGFKGRIILLKLKMKRMRMMMRMMPVVVEHLVHMTILISNVFITNETCVVIK